MIAMRMYLLTRACIEVQVENSTKDKFNIFANSYVQNQLALMFCFSRAWFFASFAVRLNPFWLGSMYHMGLHSVLLCFFFLETFPLSVVFISFRNEIINLAGFVLGIKIVIRIFINVDDNILSDSISPATYRKFVCKMFFFSLPFAIFETVN